MRGITGRIREILSDWHTVSDVVDQIGDDASKNTIMQIISRMKGNGEVESRDEVLIGRTVKSYKIVD